MSYKDALNKTEHEDQASSDRKECRVCFQSS